MRLSRSKIKLSSMTGWSDLPFVVVISGARKENSQKNYIKVYGYMNSINLNLQIRVKFTTCCSDL